MGLRRIHIGRHVRGSLRAIGATYGESFEISTFDFYVYGRDHSRRINGVSRRIYRVMTYVREIKRGRKKEGK